MRTEANATAPVIEADLSAMSSLVCQLRSLGVELGNHGGLAATNLGEPRLTAALAAAEADWSKHRRQLQAFLDQAADAVAGAAEQYSSTEQAIVTAARGGP